MRPPNAARLAKGQPSRSARHRHLHLMADYGAAGVWDHDGAPLDPAKLPLSPKLRARLARTARSAGGRPTAARRLQQVRVQVDLGLTRQDQRTARPCGSTTSWIPHTTPSLSSGRRAGVVVKVCSTFQPCFLAVERPAARQSSILRMITSLYGAGMSNPQPPQSFYLIVTDHDRGVLAVEGQ
jgi:hypothetical protein